MKMSEFWRHNKNHVLYDTSFWIELGDPNNKEVNLFFDAYTKTKAIMLPYPSLFEFLNDKLIKNKFLFEKVRDMLLVNKRIIYYKTEFSNDHCIKLVQSYFETAEKSTRTKDKKRNPNLVDLVIREIIRETSHPFVFVTTNIKDFIDVCNGNNHCHSIDFRKKEIKPSL